MIMGYAIVVVSTIALLVYLGSLVPEYERFPPVFERQWEKEHGSPGWRPCSYCGQRPDDRDERDCCPCCGAPNEPVYVRPCPIRTTWS